jgi:tRNA1Val (adenine37-N6)-methyltransferase
VGFTQDSIKEITLFQPKRGYRFSVEALLLEDFVSAKRLYRGVELGTGSGIISILLTKRLEHAHVIAVEIQKSLAQCAKRNVEHNKLDKRIEVLNEDIRNLKKVLPAHKFDFVFSNPPFRKVKTGLISADNERAVARHEINITLKDLIRTASYLLKNTGKFYLIYHPFRITELVGTLQRAQLEPKRMKFVHSRMGEEAKMVLIEAVKGSGIWLKIEAPLFIYDKGGQYTVEMKKIYA